ncbi:hypothetical protein NEIG_01823 [Nematocida sp. ERTm5]|nr:hypothetical protein NEIG_01823 [Nematocida sp. ERTm5]
MQQTEQAWELIKQEIDGSRINKLQLSSILNKLSLNERKNILKLACNLISRSLKQNEVSLSEIYIRGKKMRKRLSTVLSVLNIQPGQEKHLPKLPIYATVKRAVLKLAEEKAENEISEIAKDVTSAIRSGLPANKNNNLKVQILLLKRIGRMADVEKEVLSAYREETPYFIAEIKSVYGSENVETAQEKIEYLKKIPGFLCWAGVEALPSEIKRKIQVQVGNTLFMENVLTERDILLLLRENGANVLSELLQFRMDQPSKLKIRDIFIKALDEHIKKINAFDGLMQVRLIQWPPPVGRKIKKMTRKILKIHIKKSPNEYSKLLIEKIKREVTEKLPKEEVPFLRVIADEVSSTDYFENNLVIMLVDELLKGAPVEQVKNSIRIVRNKWKYALKRRVDELINDFVETETLQDGKISLIRTNSFRWPKSIKSLNIPGIPEISEIKREIEKSKRRKKIRIDWVDTLSVVEIQINSGSAILTLPQYWIVLKLCDIRSVLISDVKSAIVTYKEQIAPLLRQNIVEMSKDSLCLEPGTNFNNESAWTDLLPEFIEKEKEVHEEKKKLLTNLSIDSYLTKELKRTSPQKKTEILNRIVKLQKVLPKQVDQRISVLTQRELLSYNAEEDTLSYLP